MPTRLIRTPAQGIASNDTRRKASVIIPALNEEMSIGEVVRQIPQQYVSEVIVVDNGSADRTAEVAAAAGATVLSERRRGYDLVIGSRITGAREAGAMLDRMDDQHFIATSLELIRDTLNLNVEGLARELIAHRIKIGR